MPRRKEFLVNGEYYHIYNRSTAGITIFSGVRALERALGLLDYYRFPQEIKYSRFLTLGKEEKNIYEKEFRKKEPIVSVFAFSLMPNHYHLLLRQLANEGIREYISNFQKGYAKYINLKRKRFGSVFQGPFKVKHIESEEYLLHLSRYIHLNPVTSYLIEIEDLEKDSRTSLPFYSKENVNARNFVDTIFLIKIVGSYKKYKKFILNQADYQRKLAKIKELLLE